MKPITHGESRIGKVTAEYRAWLAMLQRCRDPNKHNWKHYGGRGITICERWLKYENFLADMGRKPSPELSLDRINNDLGYDKSNCRWTTRSEQERNKQKCYRQNGKKRPRDVRGRFVAMAGR